MTLSDIPAYMHIIGCLMHKPLLFVEFPDIDPKDVDYKLAKICLIVIKNLYVAGAEAISVFEIDQEMERIGGASLAVYKNDGGLEFLKKAYEIANLANFDLYYNRVKKNALLRKLQAAHYDISEFYIDNKDIKDPLEEVKRLKHLEDSSIEDILNSIEKKYNEIRNEFVNHSSHNSDPASGIYKLIEDFRTSPSVGPSLEGEMFSAACRGAREGCFYLKSASTSGGKSRTSIFDACHIAYPKRWSHEHNEFIVELDEEENIRQPRKVLFIVTEMDKEELQSIMLAYLSGVDEEHIITGKYEEVVDGMEVLDEYQRVQIAAQIMEEYKGYFLIEEITDPNLQNIESTIKKYATVDNVKYVFFDYIHTTASLVTQFGKNGLREDVILMLLANQLKQLAKDYNIFIFSATQVNAAGMGFSNEDDEFLFKDEKCIRGSKAVADKADVGYVMTRISVKLWNSIKPKIKIGVRDGYLDPDILDSPPTHVLDIYKMRRGRYKMVRIWSYIHLGTGERKDLFMTDADNQPMKQPIQYYTNKVQIIKFKKKEKKEKKDE